MKLKVEDLDQQIEQFLDFLKPIWKENLKLNSFLITQILSLSKLVNKYRSILSPPSIERLDVDSINYEGSTPPLKTCVK